MRPLSGPRRLLGWFLGGGLLMGLGLLVHYSVGWGALLEPWEAISPGSLSLALTLVIVSYAIRTIRVHQYFAPDTGGAFLQSFRIILLHNLFNNLLPMRSGEASFPLLMKRSFQISFTRSVPGLFYLRFLDLHFLLLLAIGVFAGERGGWSWILPLLFLPLPFLGFALQGWVQARIRQGALAEGQGITWLDGLPRSRRGFLGSWFWTAVNWSVKLLVFAWILGAFTDLSFSLALLGSITGELSSVLPFHGLAGAGTYEAGVMVSLVPLGVQMEEALTGAVNLHLFVLGASILSALLALLLPGKGRTPAPAQNPEFPLPGEPEGGS